MVRTLLVSLGSVSILAASCLLATGANSASAATRNAAPAVIAAATNASPGTRAQAVESLDAAVAAAVIGSVSSQFNAGNVRVQLDGMSVAPSSIQDRQVTGEGRLQIDGDSEWIPFKFAALYDTASTEVTSPQLQLGGGTASPIVPRSTLARAFNTQVARALATEFSDQHVGLFI